MSLPREWQPGSLPDLIRVGGRYDGGYVVPERAVERTDVLVSFGLSDDWTFEEDFCARNRRVRVVGYDHSLTAAFWAKRLVGHAFRAVFGLEFGRILRLLDWIRFRRFFDGRKHEHRRQKIGYAAPDGETAHGALARFPNEKIFLKIDIEGWEYRILDQVVRHGARLTGLVIEFHDVDLMRDRIGAFLRDMRSRFMICHVHGNNCAGVDGHDDPIVIEMTLLNRDLLGKGEPAGSAACPRRALDAPNDPSREELALRFDAS